MRYRLVPLVMFVGISGCTPPVAPFVPDCDDGYHPAMCMEGEEVCETDDRGCRMCSCEMEE
jgi:hypothetical protein